MADHQSGCCIHQGKAGIRFKEICFFLQGCAANSYDFLEYGVFYNVVIPVLHPISD
jgi:hypothetical protein